MSLMDMANRAFDNTSKLKSETTLSEREIDNKILECKRTIHSIKEQLEELKKNWTALKEDYQGFSFYRHINTDVKESLQKAVDDLKLQYEDTKDTLQFYKELKNKVLLENSVEEINVDTEQVLTSLNESLEEKDISGMFDIMFDAYVPKTGKASTVGGEYARAVSKILYVFYDKGDVFYMGDGLNSTAGNAASYLMTVEDGFWYNELVEVRDQLLQGAEYEEFMERFAVEVIQYIVENPQLLAMTNSTNFASFNKDQLIEIQPLFDFYADLPYRVVDALQNDEISVGELAEKLIHQFAGVDIDNIFIDEAGSVHISNLPYDCYLELEDKFDSLSF